jgi:hypothetical protein
MSDERDQRLDEWIKENAKITDDLQKLFSVRKYKAYNCIVSMIFLSIQQYRNMNYGELAEIQKVVELAWSDIVEIEKKLEEKK